MPAEEDLDLLEDPLLKLLLLQATIESQQEPQIPNIRQVIRQEDCRGPMGELEIILGILPRMEVDIL